MSTPTIFKNLRQAESLFRVFFDNAAVGMALLDGYGRFLEINPRFHQMLGASADHLPGATFESIAYADDGLAIERLIGDMARGRRREISREARIFRGDGSRMWVKVQITPLELGDVRLMAIVEDIDDRKESERALIEQKRLFKEMLDARTREVLEATARVRHAERMAVIGTLSAGLGHDMANLLVPVHIRLETLSRMDLPDEAQDHLAAIKSSAAYLQKLSGGLRLLAADPATAARGGPTELGAWWEDSSRILRAALPGSVSLKADLPAVPTWVGMAKTALLQAVFNLVQNAGDALRDRMNGRVVVKAEADGDHIRISVSDNGPGMAEEVRRRCFEPFFTTKHRSISTGLGLSIVYGLMKEVGGEVDIHSEPDNGTTFVLRLKRSATPEELEARRPRRVARVQVVDQRLRALIAMELRGLGYDVELGANDAGKTPGVVVSDRVLEPPPGGRLVLLTDDPNVPASAIALGSKPAVQAIRTALRDATASAEKEGTP